MYSCESELNMVECEQCETCCLILYVFNSGIKVNVKMQYFTLVFVFTCF